MAKTSITQSLILPTSLKVGKKNFAEVLRKKGFSEAQIKKGLKNISKHYKENKSYDSLW